MPPRHGKSELCSKYFPSWYLGTFPRNRIITASVTKDLATGFSEQARNLLAEHGQSAFGVKLRDDKQSKSEWELESGGGCKSVGIGGNIFGFGSNITLMQSRRGASLVSRQN
jgi:hypothetical protein